MNEREDAVFDELLAFGREERRTAPVARVRLELGMCEGTIQRLRREHGLKFQKKGFRYFYNIAEVAWKYLNAPMSWKLDRVKIACEKYLKNRIKARDYHREWRARNLSQEPAAANGKNLDVVDMANARCDAVALTMSVDPKTMRASFKPVQESAGTRLALQDAEQALAKTREERDALKAENAELREQIRELEHERHCALLQSKANSQDAAHWKQTAEAMTKMFMDVEGELRELKAKAACEEA